METYEILEMIKELTESPGKEFESIPLRDGEAPVYATITDGKIFFSNSLGESTALYYIDLDWKWEEVKKHLTFMEVLEIAEQWDRKTLFSFKYRKDGLESRYYRKRLDEILLELSEGYHDHQIARMLLGGKFYVTE